MASAKREGKPDFEFGYMYQNTDRKYRDYYMFTFDIRFPRKKRVECGDRRGASNSSSHRSRRSMRILQAATPRCSRSL